MLTKNTQRFLSFVMAFLMVFSLFPVQALAAETEEHNHDHAEVQEAAPAETLPAETEVPVNQKLLDSLQATIDEMLTRYLGTTQMTTEEVYAAVYAMEDYWAPMGEVYDFEESDAVLGLTEAEAMILVERNNVFSDFGTALFERRANDKSIALWATTVNPLDKKVSVTDSVGTGKLSNGTVTITATGGSLSKTTNSITITNESDKAATVSFGYSVSNADSHTFPTDSGTISQLLDPGASLSYSITSKRFKGVVTLTLSNFGYVEAAASSNVTIEFDSSLGSVTAAGNAVNSGDIVEASLAEGLALVATASNSTFLGWVDASGYILSTSASHTLLPGSDMTVKAAFVASTGEAWFQVGSNLFDDLNAAHAFAVSNSIGTIILAGNGTLPAGNYTINSGKTLLIPFNSSNTMYTTEPGSDSSFLNQGTYATPTAYRTLTLADGANITVNGAISLSAKIHAASGGKGNAGSPTGPCSFMKMNGGSTITLNNGANLYAWGFITGTGTITATSGSTVYECFQFEDFRGGSQTTTMENKVFPLSQYYVQNIEVPLTLEAGAKEVTATNIFMSQASIQFSVDFIGSNSSIFSINSGSITKKYDPATDRLILDGTGNFGVSSTRMSISGTKIDSAEYVLPINNNITVYVREGSAVSFTQDLALLPGTEVYIEEGATVTVGEGTSVYAYDVDQWGNFVFENNKNVTLAKLKYAPGRTGTRAALADAKVQIDGTMDASAGYVYTTAGGANIYSTGTGVVKTTAGTQTVTHQLVQGTGYTAIPITPAKLKNADGNYTETTDAAEATTYNYCDTHGLWYTNACEKCQAAECDHVYDNACDTTCNVCQDIREVADHVYDNACDADCNECGTTRTPADHVYDNACDTTCNVCQDIREVADHVYDNVCDADCNECGTTRTPADHVYDNACDTTCNVCGDERVIKHAWNDGVYTAPTFEADGYTTYTCTTDGCGVTKVVTDEGTKLVAVAEVNGTKYTTLTEAVNAAPENGTVTLLANSTETVTVSKALTIVKGGFTAYITAGEGYEAVDSDESVIITKKAVATDKLTPKSATLSLEDVVYINFYYTYTDGMLSREYIENNGGMLIWNAEDYPGDEEASIYDANVEISEGMIYVESNGRYMARTNGIPLRYLNNKLVIVGYVKREDGTYLYSPSKEYSGRIWAENRYATLDKTEANGTLTTKLRNERELCFALLNAIAEAQVYFANLQGDPIPTGEELANYSLSEERKNINWTGDLLTPADSVDETKTLARNAAVFTGRSATLNLVGKTEINFYFAIPDATKTSAIDSGVLFWSKEDYDKATTLDSASATYDVEMTYNATNQRWCGTYPEGFASSDYEKTIYACAYLIDSEGNIHYSGLVSYSVEQFCANQIKNNKPEAELSKDLVNYGEKAKVFFAS